MPAFIRQFQEAASNIEPVLVDSANAISAHSSVRSCLESDDTLKGYGVDTTLIGSYKRKTAIRRVKDVDVFVKLPDLDPNLDSGAVFDLLVEALEASCDPDDLEPQDRSVKVSFKQFDLTVDAVAARQCGDVWEIPDGDDGWLATNPEKMTELTTAMNKQYDELYVPVVKLIRQTRRNLLGDEKPGGYLFEVLTYHAFNSGLTGTDLGTLYVQAMTRIAAALPLRGPTDPTMPGTTVKVPATDEQWVVAAETFRKAALSAMLALDSDDRCMAAKTFREVLGENSAGNWVFPTPVGCNVDGTAVVPTVTKVGSRTAPGGGGGFA